MKMRAGFVTNSSSSSFLLTLLIGTIPAAGAILGLLSPQVGSAPASSSGHATGGEKEGTVEGEAPAAGQRGTRTFSGDGRILEGQEAMDWLTERGFLADQGLTQAFWQWWDRPWSEPSAHPLQGVCGEFGPDNFNDMVIIVSDAGRPDAPAAAAEPPLPEPAPVEPVPPEDSDLSLPDESPQQPNVGEAVTPPADPAGVPQGEVKAEKPPAESPPRQEDSNLPLQGSAAWEEKLNNLIQRGLKDPEGNYIPERINALNGMDRVFQVTISNTDGSRDQYLVVLNNGVAEIKQETCSGQPNVSVSLPRDFFEGILKGEVNINADSVKDILKNLGGVHDDGTVDELLTLFNAEAKIRTYWRAYKDPLNVENLFDAGIEALGDAAGRLGDKLGNWWPKKD